MNSALIKLNEPCKIYAKLYNRPSIEYNDFFYNLIYNFLNDV